jgi:hypothetical protein
MASLTAMLASVGDATLRDPASGIYAGAERRESARLTARPIIAV